jgi:ribosomal protein S18 acetylase RimI-like enzyme
MAKAKQGVASVPATRSKSPHEHVDEFSESLVSFSLRKKPGKKKYHPRSTLPTRDDTNVNKTDDHSVDQQIPVSKKSKTAAVKETSPLAPYCIRQMEMSDIDSVFNLGLAIFTSKEFPNMYRLWDDFSVVENFASSREFCYVAKIESTGEIVAFLLGMTLTKYSVGTRGYIQWVCVVPQYRRHRIATELISRFVAVAKDQKVSMLLADTPASNVPAINMFQKTGLADKTDHVYLTRRLKPSEGKRNKVSDDGEFHFNYTAKKKHITVRNMEIKDLSSVYDLGNIIFTSNHSNIWNFWDEDAVMHNYINDPEFCIVATAKIGSEAEKVVGFAFGTTIEKPKSSWKYGYLIWTGCDPNYQGLGLASQLYNTMVELFAIEKVRMLMIDTQVNNEAAIKFFRKLGFGHDEKHVYLCNKAMEEAGHDTMDHHKL